MGVKVWNPTSGNLASTDANWVGGVKPSNGDSVQFDNTNVGNCTFDLALTLVGFHVESTYSGIIVTTAAINNSGNAAHFHGGSVSITYPFTSGTIEVLGGTLTLNADTVVETSFVINTGSLGGNASYWLTLNAGCTWTYTAGTVVSYTLNVKTLGTITIANPGGTWRSLWVATGSVCTWDGYASIRVSVIVDGTLNVKDAGDYINLNTWTGGVFTVNGSVIGDGYIALQGYASNFTVAPGRGTIDCHLKLQVHASSSGNCIFTLGQNLTLGKGLVVESLHGTYTMTLLQNGAVITLGGLYSVGNRTSISGLGKVVCSSYTMNGTASSAVLGGDMRMTGDLTLTLGNIDQNGYHIFCSRVVYGSSALSNTGGVVNILGEDSAGSDEQDQEYLLWKLLDTHWNVGNAPKPKLYYKQDIGEADIRGPVIKIYQLDAPSPEPMGLGYTHEERNHRLTIDLKCNDRDTMLDCRKELLRIMKAYRVNPGSTVSISGYDLMKCDTGREVSGYTGFYHWVFEVFLRQVAYAL